MLNCNLLLQKRFIETLRLQGRSIISIAHRLSTVKNCDKIYVLENGKIMENGTFEELKNKNGIFLKMIHSS